MCDQENLNRIGSTKTCASEDDAWEWIKKLEFSGHYNKPYVNIDNIGSYDESHFETLKDIIKYQNVYLIRESFVNIAKRGLEAFAYIRVKKSIVQAEDSLIGFVSSV